MCWARAGVVVGLLLVALGFGAGIEPVSVSVAGRSYGCGSPIPISWFAGGSPAVATPRPPAVAAGCRAVVSRDRWLTWGLLGVGGLAALVGWTVLREERPAARAVLA